VRAAAWTALAVMTGLAGATPLSAQSAVQPERATDSRIPEWMFAWSPLAPLADHPRTLPRAPALPHLVLSRDPRIGLFWTAGNPGSLAFEVHDAWSAYQVARSHDAGSYRRPLDPDRSGVSQVTALGWQPLGANGAAAGRVIVDQEAMSPSSNAVSEAPYGTSPFAVTDSATPSFTHVRTRLEGGAGWRRGGWGVGLLAGFEGREKWTRSTGSPRTGRVSVPGATVGVVREIAAARLRLGLFARWLGSYETLRVVPQAAAGIVFPVAGYSEPDRLTVSQRPGYFRRIERDATAYGLGAAGSAFGVSWTAYAERDRRRDAFFSEERGDPPLDVWRAKGWVAGGAAQRHVSGTAVLLTARVRASGLTGDATRADLEGIFFHAEEQVFAADLDVRATVPNSPWSLAAILGTARASRKRFDFIAETRSEFVAWTPGAALEASREIGTATTVAAGFAVSGSAAVAAIPNPGLQGPVYQRLIAPELALYGTAATPTAASVSLRRRVGARTSLWIRAVRESLVHGKPTATTADGPNGERTLWSVALGAFVDER